MLKPITLSNHARKRIAQRLGITDPELAELETRRAYKHGERVPYELMDKFQKRSLSNTFRLYKNAIWVFKGTNQHCLITVITIKKSP